MRHLDICETCGNLWDIWKSVRHLDICEMSENLWDMWTSVSHLTLGDISTSLRQGALWQETVILTWQIGSPRWFHAVGTDSDCLLLWLDHVEQYTGRNNYKEKFHKLTYNNIWTRGTRVECVPSTPQRLSGNMRGYRVTTGPYIIQKDDILIHKWLLCYL